MRTQGGNGSKHPNEILAEIDRTRGEMDRTLAAIEQRLTPGQLVDQGLDYLRQSGANEFVQNLGGTAKQNPMPVAVTAIGLAWLMALGRQPAQQNYGASSSSGIREKASGMMQSASGKLGSARDSATQLGDSAKQQWQRARGSIDSLVNEQPLALGAIGLAIGAILGAAAPRTRLEEETIGPASRNLTEKAKEMGSQQLDKATQAAKQVVEKPKDQGKQQPADQKGAW